MTCFVWLPRSYCVKRATRPTLVSSSRDRLMFLLTAIGMEPPYAAETIYLLLPDAKDINERGLLIHVLLAWWILVGHIWMDCLPLLMSLMAHVWVITGYFQQMALSAAQYMHGGSTYIQPQINCSLAKVPSKRNALLISTALEVLSGGAL